MGWVDLSRLALAFGASLVSYRGGRGPRPFSAAWAVTNRCNLRCVYCNTPFLDPTELPPDRVRLLFERLRALGVRRLGLAGGEPLIRRDIGAIVALAKSMGFFVTMNSNLVIYGRKPEVFDDVDVVFTSLDGDEETHLSRRGERSLDGVMSAIGDLRRRRKPVVAIMVVGAGELEQAERLLATARTHDFRMHFQPQCVDTAIVRGGLGEDVTSDQLRAFFAHLLERKRAGAPIASSVGYLEAMSRWKDFRVTAFADPDSRCAAGSGFLYVDPLGDAYPCAYTKGRTEPINLFAEDWRRAFKGGLPCTSCNVGPYVEFNLLFERPLRAGVAALRRIT